MLPLILNAARSPSKLAREKAAFGRQLPASFRQQYLEQAHSGTIATRNSGRLLDALVPVAAAYDHRLPRAIYVRFA